MNEKEKKFISLVMYLHNASDYLKYFFDTVLPVFEANFAEYEIVCVDDGCQDNTVDVLKEYVKSRQVNAMVNIIHMSFYQGQEAAMNAGRDMAIGDFIYEFDSVYVDYKPEILIHVYEKLLVGNDIVAASTKGKIRFTSRLFYFFYNKSTRSRGKIGPETFRLVSRRAVNRIKSMDQYIPYRKAVYMNCGLKTAILQYECIHSGQKAVYRPQAMERSGLALDSFIYFTNILEKLSAAISVLFLAMSVGMGAYIVYDYFSAYTPVEGWLSTMGFLSVGFFGVFLLLTIILKYLSVILNLIFKQQRYLISDTEKVVKN